jgi:glucose-1-phosphate thymidylyltransferase
MILLARVPDPQRFGVPRFDGARLLEVVEKPSSPPSAFAVTGVYFYDAAVYDIVRTLRPSARGELEISEVNTRYIERDQMHWAELGGRWTDAGTLDSYARAQAQAPW